jgi:D-alanyl-D-alanine carboxypeptidase
MSARIAMIVAALALASSPARSQANVQLEPAIAARIDESVGVWLSNTHAPSVSIAIVEHGTPVFAKAYGRARLNPDAAASTDTRYAIDSVSKQFTAAAILELAEQHKLSLDDELGKWFPQLGAASRTTLRQVLSHTSGIRDYWPEDFATPPMLAPTTPAALVQAWAARGLDFEPGTDWQYSNTGYVLAGMVVERVSGKPLFRFLQDAVFTPLHMTRVLDYSQSETEASGYSRYALGPVHPAPKEALGWLFGAAGLAMTPSDLALWDESLIDRSLLNAESYAAQRKPVTLKDGSTRPYGLGLAVNTDSQDRPVIGHSGEGSGFLAESRLWPEQRVAIVALTNNDWASPGDLVDRLAYLVLPPTRAEARARALFEAFQNGTVDRSQFTAAGQFYLTDQALAEQRASLAPLGPALLIELERHRMRGGMVMRVWKVLCRDARLQVIERAFPDGRLAQFLITKRED